MGRRKSINNEQILQAARKLFMEQGYQASTAAIAKSAGVSEGTIFNRFPTKEELFNTAMDLPDIEIKKVVQRLLQEPEVKKSLQLLISEVLEFFRDFMPRMMMLTFSNHSGKGLAAFRDHKRSHATRILAGISEFFTAQVNAGRMRRCNPEVCARMMLGSIMNFVISERVGIVLEAKLEPEKFTAELVEILWSGIGQD